MNEILGVEYLTYENTSISGLVAIAKTDQQLIKKYWKKNKGKSKLALDTITGYPFIQDEEQDSLKIDFSEIKSYLIKDLIKFD